MAFLHTWRYRTDVWSGHLLRSIRARKDVRAEISHLRHTIRRLIICHILLFYSPYATERYVNEVKRLYTVLDHRLADRKYLVDTYSIADLKAWGW